MVALITDTALPHGGGSKEAPTGQAIRLQSPTCGATGQVTVTGLPEVGLTEETARLLRGWYAHKLRSVLNQPAHVSRIPTADLFRLHSIRGREKNLVRPCAQLSQLLLWTEEIAVAGFQGCNFWRVL